jgi:ATP-dependent RNA helicase DeaD
MKFQDLNLDHSLLHGLKNMGIEQPTDIQSKAIPTILDNPDTHIIAQAKTGSGKTLAFSIPIAERVDFQLKEVQCVIILPTRELCKQVAEVFMQLTKYHPVKVVQVYGGVSIDRQIQQIQEGAQIVAATPGRLIDIYNRHRINFDHVKFVVLDEADRCLDMGFMPDIEYILLEAMHNISPRLFLFSATMFEAVIDLTRRFTKGKNVLEINVSEDDLTVDNCVQEYYLIDEFRDKYYHFLRIVRQEHPKHSMIFVNTKKTGDWLYNRLMNERNFKLKPELISGNLTQKRREIVLDKFRKRKINCLIATDVAARGLDIEKVSHVFNYDLPEFEESYIHRIGRTARISGTDADFEKGKAISLVLKDQMNILARIEGIVNKPIQKKPLPLRPNNRGEPSPQRGRSSPRPQRYSRDERGPRHSSKSDSRTRSKKRSDKPDRRNFLY